MSWLSIVSNLLSYQEFFSKASQSSSQDKQTLTMIEVFHKLDQMLSPTRKKLIVTESQNITSRKQPFTSNYHLKVSLTLTIP